MGFGIMGMEISWPREFLRQAESKQVVASGHITSTANQGNSNRVGFSETSDMNVGEMVKLTGFASEIPPWKRQKSWNLAHNGLDVLGHIHSMCHAFKGRFVRSLIG